MIYMFKSLLLCLVLSICFSFQESIQSDNDYEDIAVAFTSNILSGMNYFPKETQLSVVKNLLYENEIRMNGRRLSDLHFREVFYVQIYKSIPIYEFIELLNHSDPELEYEIIGGDSHSIIVYTYDSILLEWSEHKSLIQAFFPFPPLSKITIQLMNEITSRPIAQENTTLEITTMGVVNTTLWESEFVSHCSPSLLSMEQVLEYFSNQATQQTSSCDCSYHFYHEDNLLLVDINNACVVPFIAFLSKQPNIIRLDLPTHYQLPSLSSSHLLRNYSYQEVVATRSDVQVFYQHQIHGEHRIIGLSDTGVDIHSCFFEDSQHSVRYDPKLNDTAHRKIFLYYPFSNSKEDNVDGHGSHVAGTLVGEVDEASSFSKYNGIAYKARLAFVDIGSGKGKDAQLETPRKIVQLVDLLYSNGASIQSASWGVPSSSYSSDTASIDSYVYNHPDCLLVFAAGNDGEKGQGSIYSPASGKNVLAVGSVYNQPQSQDIRASFSCEGPTSDLRIKPDIMAPGVNIDSAASNGNEEASCRIVAKTGTSMSTPVVAAASLLLQQYLEEGYYPSGLPCSDYGFHPTAATLKAMIIHSGQALRGEGSLAFPTLYKGTIPDNKQGFGRMSIQDIVYWRNESSTNLFIQQTQVNQSLSRVSFIFQMNISF